MKLVERTPRLSIAQLRSSPDWGAAKESKRVLVSVEHGSTRVTTELELDADETELGRRFWLLCPACGTRRRHLFLLSDTLRCRSCGKLVYWKQSLPATRWRAEVARPAFKVMRESSQTS